jgi:hypothetical protein
VPLTIFLVTLGINDYIENGIKKEGVIIFSIFTIILAAIIFLLQNSKKASFNSDFFFVKGGKVDDEIALDRVREIGYVIHVSGSIPFTIWKITYLLENDERRTVRLVPSMFNSNFEDFVIQVKNHHKKSYGKFWVNTLRCDH